MSYTPDALLTAHLPLETVRGIAIKWAKEMLKLDSFYIVDTETTGIDVEEDAFVQVACLHHPTMLINSWEINPERVISYKAMRVHKKDNESRVGLPTFGDIYNHLANRLNGVPMVIYNVPFDYPLLQNQAKRYKKPEFTPSTVIDAMTYAALSYGMWNDSRGKGFWQAPKLTKWAELMQVYDIENAHDARSDVLFVYEAMMKLTNARW